MIRIEPGAVYQRYQAYNPKTGKADIPVIPKEGQAKTDTVSISDAAAREAGIGRLTQNITAELEAGASTTRLQALQEKIANHEYNIPTQELANAILGLRG